ncbi:MAG: biopolymer transporter ExbD [Bacteroidota bacterium]
MADVDTSQGGGGKKGSGPKTKKKSTKVDMTAMVDVAFLLLTFFVLTATISDSSMMEMVMPPKADENIDEEDLKKKLKEDKIMTLILDEDDKVSYWVGITEPEVESADYSSSGLRKVLRDHIETGPRKLGLPLCAKGGEVNDDLCWDPIFVFKSKDEARFKNLVDMLDELAIVGATKYTIDKYSPTDSLILIGEYTPELADELEK